MLEEKTTGTAKAEPKKYKCIKTCYINGFLYKAGDVVTGQAPCKEYFTEMK